MNTMRTVLVKLALVSTIGATLLLVGAASAGAATGTTGVHQSGSVQCIAAGSTFAGGSNLQAAAPSMYAFNYTSGVDRQTVTFQPIVFRWNGSAWVLAVTGVTLMATATDSASPTTWYNTANSASWGTGTEAFALPPANYYKVAYKMSWYYSSPVSGNPATLSGSDYLWASSYSLASPLGAPLPAISYCTT